MRPTGFCHRFSSRTFFPIICWVDLRNYVITHAICMNFRLTIIGTDCQCQHNAIPPPKFAINNALKSNVLAHTHTHPYIWILSVCRSLDTRRHRPRLCFCGICAIQVSDVMRFCQSFHNSQTRRACKRARARVHGFHFESGSHTIFSIRRRVLPSSPRTISSVFSRCTIG